MNCIETHQLSYSFGRQAILQGLNLQVPQGSIYGFLGPNGAGKTTTLRLLLGLLKKQQGEIKLFDKSITQNRIDILKQTGSLIESPSLYGHLSVYENLQVWQKIYRCPNQRLGEALELVGLGNASHKKARQLSLGMKQRLGIAVALLHQPQLLILDEPTNGLDPNGMLEVRELLKRLNAEHNITIVMSSHLLSEVEKLVSHVGIINKGALLFQGTLAELQMKQNQQASTVFETNDVFKSLELTKAAGWAAFQHDHHLVLHQTDNGAIAAINALLVQHGIQVYGISSRRSNLESIFMDLIK